VTFILIALINWFVTVKSLPPGPLAFPLIGTYKIFKPDGEPHYRLFQNWYDKYGKLFTVWWGTMPTVVVNSYALTMEARVKNRNTFTGRNDMILGNIIRMGQKDIAWSQGSVWEVLRKVGVIATRKFAFDERLPLLVNEDVDYIAKLMIKNHDNKHFDPQIYYDLIAFNITSMMTFSRRYGMEDKEFHDLKKFNDEFYDLVGHGLPSDFYPGTRPLFYHREKQLKRNLNLIVDVIKRRFYENKADFDPESKPRDYIDCMIAAKNEAIAEDSTIRLDSLKDDNLIIVVKELYFATTDAVQTGLKWLILLLANNPEIQEKIYKEVNDNVGTRMVAQEDKLSLPYTYAFIMETLRIRPPGPISLDLHVTTCDTELGGHKFAKGTTFLFNYYSQHRDTKYWDNPEEFRPERFLDSEGNLITGRVNAWVPFGVGQRMCVAEKLAMNLKLLLLVNFVQRLKFELKSENKGSQISSMSTTISLLPERYQVMCSPRDGLNNNC